MPYDPTATYDSFIVPSPTILISPPNLRAYHGSRSLKMRLVDELQKHYDADQIIKGTYGHLGINGKFVACAVGCTLDSLGYRGRRHSAYPELLGIPVEIAMLQDVIFERLPESHYREWPIEFAKVIWPGADLRKVADQFILWVLTEPEYGISSRNTAASIFSVIGLVADAFRDKADGRFIYQGRIDTLNYNCIKSNHDALDKLDKITTEVLLCAIGLLSDEIGTTLSAQTTIKHFMDTASIVVFDTRRTTFWLSAKAALSRLLESAPIDQNAIVP